MSFECNVEAQPEQSGGSHPARPRSSACHRLTSGGTPGGEYGGSVADPHGGWGPPVAAVASAGMASMKSAAKSSFKVGSFDITRRHPIAVPEVVRTPFVSGVPRAVQRTFAYPAH